MQIRKNPYAKPFVTLWWLSSVWNVLKFISSVVCIMLLVFGSILLATFI